MITEASNCILEEEVVPYEKRDRQLLCTESKRPPADI